MELFYTPFDPDDFFELPADEARHVIRVLRLGKGDEVLLTNGKGVLYRARIEDTENGKCSVRITERKSDYGKRPYRVHIAIAPTKNTERLEWFLEKATEIGIDEITPIICRHSERKEIKEERLNKVLISAIKQSRQAYLPVLNQLCSFLEFLTRLKEPVKIICLLETPQLLKSIVHPGEDVLILIGPEGDFNPEEIQMAIKAGFKPASLGKNRLRTETAALVACSTVAIINQ